MSWLSWFCCLCTGHLFIVGREGKLVVLDCCDSLEGSVGLEFGPLERKRAQWNQILVKKAVFQPLGAKPKADKPLLCCFSNFHLKVCIAWALHWCHCDWFHFPLTFCCCILFIYFFFLRCPISVWQHLVVLPAGPVQLTGYESPSWGTLNPGNRSWGSGASCPLLSASACEGS